MNNTVNKNTFFSSTGTWQTLLLSTIVLTVTACGEVDKNDGSVRNGIELPVDNVLTLFCPDAGIAAETCILDDPDNPYALTSVNDDNKFELSDAAPSAKARFYLWATAQAMSPRGENQFYVASALQEMYASSGSELAKEQSLKAYRSVLDNYYYSVTFFEADFLPPPDIFYPFPVRKLVGQNLVTPTAPLTLLFDNATQVLEEFGQWGYTYDDQVTKDFTPNF